MLEWLKSFFAKGQPEALGPRGENLAARFLYNQGFTILERNYRCQVGELDIVAKEGKTLVFVEVKTRMDDDPIPEIQVDAAKQHQLTKAARFFLSRYGHPQPPARFDVIAIVWPSGSQPQIRHIANAFEATF